MAQALIDIDSTVEISVEDGDIIIRPVREQQKRAFPFSATELLDGIDEATGHAGEVVEITDREWGEP